MIRKPYKVPVPQRSDGMTDEAWVALRDSMAAVKRTIEEPQLFVGSGVFALRRATVVPLMVAGMPVVSDPGMPPGTLEFWSGGELLLRLDNLDVSEGA